MPVLSFLLCMSIVFGILAMMFFLDVRYKELPPNRKWMFTAGNLMIFVANVALTIVLGVDQHIKLYSLVIHLPIFLVFWVATRITPEKIIFALFAAVFLIFPANAVTLIVSLRMTYLGLFAPFIAGLALYALMLFIIYRYIKSDFNYLIKNYSRLSFLKLCLLPLTYNLINFWLGFYNFSTTMPKELSYMRILLFILTLTAYVLILDIAKFAREKDTLQSSQMALTLQLESAHHQLSVLQTAQEQALIYRHDMRHHFGLIGSYLEEDQPAKALEYVRQAQGDIEDITPNRYSENNTFNLILSFFAAKAKASGITLIVDSDLPESLTLSETELCTVLANSMENAITAAAEVDEEQFRIVRVSCYLHKANLLIFIENSFTGEVTMENGLPQSKSEEHGFGVKSIRLIAEKNNGYCSFAAEDGLFTLKIALPQVL